MIDISIIIFLLALIGIIAMFISQKKKLKHGGDLASAYSSKDLSYENFKILNEKLKVMWLKFIHTTAIVLSKLWARLTHTIVSWFHRGVKRVEEQMIKHEKKHGPDDITKKSVFLTTIKTYKSEIKKLKGKVEEELPRPRESEPIVAISEKNDNIDESKPEEVK